MLSIVRHVVDLLTFSALRCLLFWVALRLSVSLQGWTYKHDYKISMLLPPPPGIELRTEALTR